MKKLFLLFLLCLLPIVSFSKTDVYFANGILTSVSEAQKNAFDVLQLSIKNSLYGGSTLEMRKHIGKVDYAYNSTLSESKDMYESYMQLKAEGGVSSFEEFMIKHFPLVDLLAGEDVRNILDEQVHERMIKEVHDADLRKQVAKYKETMDKGRSVAVIAHSQGTLFTNEAYAALEKANYTRCKKGTFNAFFVASAATKVLKKKATMPSFVFHNDIITNLSDKFHFPKTTNPHLFSRSTSP